MVAKEAPSLHQRTLAIFAVAISLLGSGQYATGRGPRAGPERGKLALTLRVYNYAISRSLLSDAEAEATVILNSAGLDPVWVDCPLSASQVKNYPSCARAIGPTDFILTMLTKAAPERVSPEEDAMGRALPCPKTEMACSAYVFYKNVQEEAVYAKIHVSRLLGHVLAHEIGHLLLGPKSHSTTGVMMAGWSDDDMQTIARGFLFFNEQQSRRMRDQLLTRSTFEQAKLESAPNPQSVAGSR
jgi:hypothetical protein